MFDFIATAAKALGSSCLDLLAPRCCLLCHTRLMLDSPAASRYVCPACMDRLDPAPSADEVYNDLLRHFPDDRLCIHGAISRFSAARKGSEGVLPLIHALKYQGCSDLAFELGQELGRLLLHLHRTDYRFLVPIPIHTARQRERSYNQAEWIARGMARETGIAVASHLVYRQRYTTTQTRLNDAQRQRNVQRAFALHSPHPTLQDANIIVIDDVLTTGSTLNSVAQLLLEHGARRVDIATIVKAE